MVKKSSFFSHEDTIGVIAVTAPAEPARFDRGLKYLSEHGYEVKVALTPTAEYGKTTYLFGSDTPKRRAEALHKLFTDKKVKAILTTRGSYGAMELLPFLDFDLIKRNAKPVIGFSDITAILIPIAQKASCPVIHGPVLEFAFSRAEQGDAGAIEGVSALFDLLSGQRSNPFQYEKLQYLKGKKNFSGQIIGGNLSIVASLLGTPWEPKLKGKILFLEDVGEGPYRVHRLLLQLKLAGCFKAVSGVILGEFTNCEHPQKLGPTLDDVLKDIFADVEVPVLTGLPCGHGKRNLPLPFEKATVKDGQIVFA